MTHRTCQTPRQRLHQAAVWSLAAVAASAVVVLSLAGARWALSGTPVRSWAELAAAAEESGVAGVKGGGGAIRVAEAVAAMLDPWEETQEVAGAGWPVEHLLETGHWPVVQARGAWVRPGLSWLRLEGRRGGGAETRPGVEVGSGVVAEKRGTLGQVTAAPASARVRGGRGAVRWASPQERVVSVRSRTPRRSDQDEVQPAPVEEAANAVVKEKPRFILAAPVDPLPIRSALSEGPGRPPTATDLTDPDEPTVEGPTVGHSVVAFDNIGYSSPNRADRHIAQNLKKVGWKGFVRDRIVPALDRGVRRIQLHNPFGAEDGMYFDQYLRNEADGLRWINDGFAEAWLPVTRGDYTDGEPVEVIAYMGHPYHGQFRVLLDAGDDQGYTDRLAQSIAAPLAAGMSIAVDSASITEDPEHPLVAYLTGLKGSGVPIYIETWPKRNSTHWFSFNVIVAERMFIIARDHPNTATRDMIQGEVIRLWAHPPKGRSYFEEDRSWLGDAVVDVLADGYTISTHIDFIPKTTPLDALVQQARGRRLGGFD